MKHKLYIAHLPFMFLNSQDLLNFLETIFTNCIEKNKLYAAIIEWNTTLLFNSCFTESIPEEEQIKIVNALEILEENYGSIYDLEKVLFTSVNKIKFN